MTVTSQIHYNCPAWVNHSFVLGEACSNVGNAYRCITAGTSTVAPTGTSADSVPGGTAHFRYLSAIDYTDLQSWHTALTPLSDHVVVQIWNNGEITTAPGVSFLQTGDDAGFTGGFTITITAAPGDSFKEKVSTTPLTYNAANGVAFRITGAAGGSDYTAFFFGLNNVILDGIQFKCDDSVGMSIIVANGSANGFGIRYCIVDFPAQPGAQWALDLDCQFSLYNNLFIDRQGVGADGPFGLFGYSGNNGGTYVNNTLVAPNSPGGNAVAFESLHTASDAILVRNSTFFGYSQPIRCAGLFGAAAVDHCCTDAASFFTCTDNGNQQFLKTATNQFVSPTVDFRLKAGSSCLNTGVSDLVNVPTGNDIYRTTRPQGVTWDIGAYELIAASSAVGSASGVGTATGRTGNTFPMIGRASGIGTALGIVPSTKLMVGSAAGIGRATGVPPVTSGVGAISLLTDINETNCVSLIPVRLPATIDPPPFRLRLAYQHNHTVQTSDLNATIAASRVQFLASPDTYAAWSSNLISRTYTRPNDPAPFGGALLILNEAQLVVNDLGDLLGGRSRLYDAELPVAFGLQFDLGDVVKLTYPMDDLRNGRVGRVVGEQFRSGEPTLRIRVLVTADSRIIGPDPPTLVTVF